VIRSSRAAPSITGRGEAPELVVIAVPAEEVLEVARVAAAKGSKALVVLRGEIADEGDQAGQREQRLLEVVRGAGIRLVGPNCLGVLNTDPGVSLNATFAGFHVPAGRLAICSESGAIGISLLGHSAARRLGVSSFASLGRRVDVSTNDLLELWEEDPRTAVVVLYVETVGNPERFARIARRVARRKPILAIKGNRRPDTRRNAARSHTSTALRGHTAVDALLHHGGVQRFRTGEELFNAAELFDRQPLPAGGQIGIVTNSAGMATLAADACSTRGLLVAQAKGPVRNPLVMRIRAGYQDYASGVRGILQDPGVDALMVSYVDPLGGDPDGILEAISMSAAGQGKPVVACVVSAEGERPTGRSIAVPNYRFPEYCADVLARAAERRDWLSRPVGESPQYDDLDSAAARRLIGSQLDRGHRDGAGLASADAEALLATHGPDCRALLSVRDDRPRDRRCRADRRADRAEGRSSAAGLRRRDRRGATRPARPSSDPSRLERARASGATGRVFVHRSGSTAPHATGCRRARRHGHRSRVRAGDGGRARRPSQQARGHHRVPPSPRHRPRRARA
jgi:acetate---CoA ligase (ADP-forming)